MVQGAHHALLARPLESQMCPSSADQLTRVMALRWRVRRRLSRIAFGTGPTAGQVALNRQSEPQWVAAPPVETVRPRLRARLERSTR